MHTGNRSFNKAGFSPKFEKRLIRLHKGVASHRRIRSGVRKKNQLSFHYIRLLGTQPVIGSEAWKSEMFQMKRADQRGNKSL